MIRAFALTVSLALPLIAACPAAAQPAGGRQAAVVTKDIDLNSRDGAVLFLRRLDAATAKVCGPAPYIRDLERMDIFKTCMAKSRADAIARLNNAEVSAVAGGPAQEAAATPVKPKT